MPVNFFPQENLFLPVYKFIFSRKEIFFLPQRNLFSYGRKFISSRKEISPLSQGRLFGFPISAILHDNLSHVERQNG